MWVSIALAATAAVLFGAGTAVQASAAAAQPARRALHLGLLARLVRSPRWALGTGLDTLGVVLHAVALRFGTLLLVQPFLCASLLCALVAESALARRRLTSRQVRAGLQLVGGLLLLVTVARTSPHQHQARWEAVALSAFALALAVVVGLGIVGKRVAPSTRARVLGLLAGASFGISAVFTRSTALGVAADGVRAVWVLSTAGAVAAGLLAVLLAQAAYQIGPLSWALPAQEVAGLILSITVGIVLLGDVARTDPLTAGTALVALALVTHAVLTLARTARVGGSDVRRGADGRTADVLCGVPGGQIGPKQQGIG